MQTYRTLQEVQESGQIVISDIPFRPGQLVEVVVRGQEKAVEETNDRLRTLLKETQGLPQAKRLTIEEVEAEIAEYRKTQ